MDLTGNFEDLPDITWTKEGVRGGAVGCDTALQVGKSWVRIPLGLMEFFIDINFPAALWPWG
jgi:hypothetical protein